MVKYVTLGMKNKFKIRLNIDKYQLLLRNGGEMSRAGDSGVPRAAPNQFRVRLPEHTIRCFTPRERLVWMSASGAYFHQSNPALFSEGQRIPGNILNIRSVPLKGFKS